MHRIVLAKGLTGVPPINSFGNTVVANPDIGACLVRSTSLYTPYTHGAFTLPEVTILAHKFLDIPFTVWYDLATSDMLIRSARGMT